MPNDAFPCYVRTHYFAEFDRKKELNSITTASTGVASLVGAADYALAFKIPIISSWFGALCYLALAFSAFFLLVAIYNLVRSYVGHEYKYSAAIRGIVNTRQMAKNAGFSTSELEVASDLLILDQYTESIAFNEQTNDNKSAFLNRGNIALVRSLAILFVLGVLLIVSNVTQQVNDGESHAAGRNAAKGT